MVGDSEWPQQMASLLENIHEDDALHDILIKVIFCNILLILQKV